MLELRHRGSRGEWGRIWKGLNLDEGSFSMMALVQLWDNEKEAGDTEGRADLGEQAAPCCICSGLAFRPALFGMGMQGNGGVSVPPLVTS